MRKMFSVLHYEYKMQFKRLVTWGVLLVATALSLLDNFPSAGNLARLEFLDEPAYFVYRIVSLDSLVLLFGLMFLLAGRIPIDTKTGMKSLLMSSALRKWQYVLGTYENGNMCWESCWADFYMFSPCSAFFFYLTRQFILLLRHLKLP